MAGTMGKGEKDVHPPQNDSVNGVFRFDTVVALPTALRRAWDRQPSFYELLRVNPKVSPTELRLAFKLRTLELHTARALVGDIRAAERAFNILAHPELRACHDALLNDPSSPAVIPYGGFGSLVVAGDRS